MALSWWIYFPTKGVSIAFAILFFISGLHHIWENNIRRRSWRVGFLFPIGAALFVAAYGIREYGAYHPDKIHIFITSALFFLVAPPVYAAADYLVIGRLLYYVPWLTPIHPGRILSTFLGLDTLVEILFTVGAVYSSDLTHPPSEILLGQKLLKISLILLTASFTLFLTLVVTVHLRFIRAGIMNRKLRLLIYTQYTSGALITIRNIERVLVFYLKPSSPYNTHEVVFWTLEALPMLLNTVILNVVPPTKYLPAHYKVYLSTDGKTELYGPGWIDRRRLLMTFLDPMDFIGLVTGKDRKERFWEEDGIGGPRKPGMPMREV